jgi:uncharacterized surface protein with fasciclin (FAS1) repeats
MTSQGPYTQSYDFTHMYNLGDLRSTSSKYKKISVCPDSMLDIIHTHPDFKKMKYMMELSGLETTYNDPQANFTIFVPSDKALSGINENIFLNMDRNTARGIIKTSTINRKIPSELLKDSMACYFYTLYPPNRLYINSIRNELYINDCIRVIGTDIITKNGIIHVIDKLIDPIMS